MTALSAFFADVLRTPAVVDLSGGGRALILSDLHMGAGRGDDFSANGPLVIRVLEDYYYRGDWRLILNGDIEELAKFRLRDIQAAWPAAYRVFDRFHAGGRLHKTLGNHDADLAFERAYPYALHDAVRVETGHVPLYVYHGHQTSPVYTTFNRLIRLSLRYLLKPAGIHNITSARSPHRRFHVERAAYAFSLRNRCVSVIGHTHRALFESLSRFDFIKYEIERLCRAYPGAAGSDRERIAAEVAHLTREMAKLRRSERHDGARRSLYGDGPTVPCLFNSGSAIGRKGIYGIEVDRDRIALVYWFTAGRGMKFISRGWYPVEPLAGTDYRRAVLNQDRLDYVRAKIELLGAGAGTRGHGGAVP